MGDQFAVYFGKFWFPFGIESQAVHSTTNALVTRPNLQAWTDNGFGAMGKVENGGVGIRWNVAATNGFSGAALFPQATDANNNNKSIGGRLEVMPMGDQLNVGGSFAFGKYDASSKNSYILGGGHVDYTWMKHSNVRGEFMWQKVQTDRASPARTAPAWASTARPPTG